MKEIVFYGSFLVFPFLLFILYIKKSFIKNIFVILSIIFIYARFVEPQIITTKHTKLELGFTWSIALISDLHIGKYKNEVFLEKLVKKINTLPVESVFIAGDLTYYPEIEDLPKLFEPLKWINKPVYWVLWNHDVEKPGPKLREPLVELFNSYGFTHLNNDVVKVGGFTLIGLGDNWSGEDNTNLLDIPSPDDHVIVLTHNPDTTLKYTNNNSDLTLAGHTHWWQIRIPFLYKHVIPTTWSFDKWWSQEQYTYLYTSSWVWETALPMRLFNPPVIDIIQIY